MDYFYTPHDHIHLNSVLIDGIEFNHLTHVMRKKEGNTIRVVDGLGTAYDVRLTELKGKTARGEIISSYPNHNEPDVSITIAVGILKNPSKFDFLVEKVTEIGVKEIIPLKTERTIPSHTKTGRWEKLALAAMKQCGRSCLPHIRELTTLDEMLKETGSFDVTFIAHEQKINPPHSNTHRRNTSSKQLILIGPEGGFSEEEVTKCLRAGYLSLYFGERRLRTETAAVVAVALALHQ